MVLVMAMMAPRNWTTTDVRVDIPRAAKFTKFINLDTVARNLEINSFISDVLVKETPSVNELKLIGEMSYLIESTISFSHMLKAVLESPEFDALPKSNQIFGLQHCAFAWTIIDNGIRISACDPLSGSTIKNKPCTGISIDDMFRSASQRDVDIKKFVPKNNKVMKFLTKKAHVEDRITSFMEEAEAKLSAKCLLLVGKKSIHSFISSGAKLPVSSEFPTVPFRFGLEDTTPWIQLFSLNGLKNNERLDGIRRLKMSMLEKSHPWPYEHFSLTTLRNQIRISNQHPSNQQPSNQHQPSKMQPSSNQQPSQRQPSKKKPLNPPPSTIPTPNHPAASAPVIDYDSISKVILQDGGYQDVIKKLHHVSLTRKLPEDACNISKEAIKRRQSIAESEGKIVKAQNPYKKDQAFLKNLALLRHIWSCPSLHFGFDVEGQSCYCPFDATNHEFHKICEFAFGDCCFRKSRHTTPLALIEHLDTNHEQDGGRLIIEYLRKCYPNHRAFRSVQFIQHVRHRAIKWGISEEDHGGTIKVTNTCALDTFLMSVYGLLVQGIIPRDAFQDEKTRLLESLLLLYKEKSNHARYLRIKVFEDSLREMKAYQNNEICSVESTYAFWFYGSLNGSSGVGSKSSCTNTECKMRDEGPCPRSSLSNVLCFEPSKLDNMNTALADPYTARRSCGDECNGNRCNGNRIGK